MSDNFLVEDWSRRLGLANTSLFDTDKEDGHYALLDGVEGSFALTTVAQDNATEQLNWTWSANLSSHVDLGPVDVLVRQVESRAPTLRFSRDQVERNLEKFFDAIVSSRAAPAMSVSDHIVACFRSHHQIALSSGLSSHDSLREFLALLGGMTAQSGVPAAQLDSRLPQDHWDRFEEELKYNRISRRSLDVSLTMRHAAGMVFQEAHAELTSQPLDLAQPQLFGLAPVAARTTRNSLGAYYTPPGLARVLSDMAIKPHLGKPEITVFDPACGSGIFLIEALHALQRRRYQGKVTLVGLDLSSAAVEMARFAVAHATRGRNNVIYKISEGDFVTTRSAPNADIVLMNPPFVAFNDLDPHQRDSAKTILGDAFGYRPDLSMVFITLALSRLKPGGTLASLLPSGVFEQTNGQNWRQQIAQANALELLAVLGDHGLFKDAMVNIAALLLQKDQQLPVQPTMLWASQKRGASSSALRRLRRWDEGARRPERTPDWAIYSGPSSVIASGEEWTPRPNSLGSLPSKLAATQYVVPVEQLFSVELGVRVGVLSSKIQIPSKTFEQLPPAEQRLFRPVAETKSIRMGKVLPVSYLLYPPKPMSLAELRKFAPKFSAQNLADIDDKGKPIEATRSRRHTNDASDPKIVSRAFIGPGSFALDRKGASVVVQGYTWIPTSEITSTPFDATSLLQDYCYILNSRLFFALVRESGRLVGGGQVDAAKKSMQRVPLPNLATMYEVYPSLQDHADFLRRTEIDQYPDASALDAFTAAAYQTSLEEWSHPI